MRGGKSILEFLFSFSSSDLSHSALDENQLGFHSEISPFRRTVGRRLYMEMLINMNTQSKFFDSQTFVSGNLSLMESPFNQRYWKTTSQLSHNSSINQQFAGCDLSFFSLNALPWKTPFKPKSMQFSEQQRTTPLREQPTLHRDKISTFPQQASDISSIFFDHTRQQQQHSIRTL